MFGDYLLDVPEHLEAPDLSADIGAGSFGAINYASAYHNPAACFIDTKIGINTLGPIIAEVARQKKRKNWELIPDRLCYRTKSQPRESSFHTDNSAGASAPSDIFFGGYVNLNRKQTQVFTLVPGTHKEGACMKGGDFTPITSSDELKAREVTVEVPPNHAIIVYENIVHRVSGKKPKSPLIRKFLAFRVSNDEHPWCPANQELIKTQGALYHKGYVQAPLYPKLWRTNWPDKCEAYAAKLKPDLVTSYTYKTGVKRGRTIAIPKLIPTSLSDLGCPYAHPTHDSRFELRSVS